MPAFSRMKKWNIMLKHVLAVDFASLFALLRQPLWHCESRNIDRGMFVCPTIASRGIRIQLRSILVPHAEHIFVIKKH